MKEFSEAIMSKNGRRILSSIVLIYGIFVVMIPVLKDVIGEGIDFFVCCVILANVLGNILYAIIANKTKSIEYILIPGVAVIISEYYLFHDYSTWIASTSTAAIALLFTPIYLLGSLAVSCGLAYIIEKIRNR